MKNQVNIIDLLLIDPDKRTTQELKLIQNHLKKTKYF
jgi:hypothetical protein